METINQIAGSLNTTPPQKSISQIWKESLRLRAEFRAIHPELDTLHPDDSRRLWRQYCGIPTPLVPSLEDETRDASCLYCSDVGWIRKRHENHIDRVIACPKCSGWEDKRKQIALNHSGIPETHRKCCFASYRVDQGNNEAYNAAYDLGKDNMVVFWMLLIAGNTGNGKTHLAYAAGIEAINRGVQCQFHHVGSLMGELRILMNRQGESADALVKSIKNSEFLILDDMGAENGGTWQQSVLEDIINHRYANFRIMFRQNRQDSLP